MRERIVFVLVVTRLALAGPMLAQEPEQKFASLGAFKLENGEVIRDFKLGYRTLGELNAAKSNAVLFTTWCTGTTHELVSFVGPGKLVDSSQYFVILVDAIGNGVTSSPSNSVAQPHMKFPRFTIGDMVRSQHEFLTRVLKITHLRGVTGISMGGNQTFQWMVRYPDFIGKAIPMMGTPRETAYDLLWLTANLHAIEADPNWKNGEYSSPPVAGLRSLADICKLVVTTPHYIVEHTKPEDFPEFLEKTEQAIIHGQDANNWVRQIQACLDQDISKTFGGSMEKAAAAVRAKVLVVVATQDHEVNPGPALSFARLLHASTLELASDCGHLTFSCEEAKISREVAEFLAE
jgi:homoserine O-acetyltransferase/O-succinyltransferase